MKKSTYFISILIVVLFFVTLGYIAHKIIELNGALPIDLIKKKQVSAYKLRAHYSKKIFY
jgi:hypothetical protein